MESFPKNLDLREMNLLSLSLFNIAKQKGEHQAPNGRELILILLLIHLNSKSTRIINHADLLLCIDISRSQADKMLNEIQAYQKQLVSP